MIIFIGISFALFCVMFAILVFLWITLSIRTGKFWMWVVSAASLILMMFTEMVSIASFELVAGL